MVEVICQEMSCETQKTESCYHHGISDLRKSIFRSKQSMSSSSAVNPRTPTEKGAAKQENMS